MTLEVLPFFVLLSYLGFKEEKVIVDDVICAFFEEYFDEFFDSVGQ